jgi:hypothetical protein
MTYWIHLLPFACIDVKQQRHSHEMKAGNLKKKRSRIINRWGRWFCFLFMFISFDCVSNPLLFPPFHPRPLGAHNLARWLWLWLSSIIYVRNQLFDSFFPRSRPIREFTFTIKPKNMSIPFIFSNTKRSSNTGNQTACCCCCCIVYVRGEASGNKQGPMKSHTII